MSTQIPTALGLFLTFFPKFKQVSFSDLRPMTLRKGELPFFFVEGLRGTYEFYDHPYIDVQKNGVRFGFASNPDSPLSFDNQLSVVIWEALLKSKFGGVRFLWNQRSLAR